VRSHWRGSLPVKAPEKSFRNLFDFRVLVVDDNATNCQVLRRQILAWEMHVDSAEALKLLKAAARDCKPYDLALLDMQMPDMDGLTLARAIRVDPAIAGTRFMLTGFSKQLSPEEPRAAGITDCCFKPVRQARLFECLANALLGPSTIPRTLAKALFAPDSRSQQIQVLTEDSLFPELVERYGLNADGYFAKGRTDVDGGDARRLLGAGDQPSRASSTVGEEVRGGICRYEIRVQFSRVGVVGCSVVWLAVVGTCLGYKVGQKTTHTAFSHSFTIAA
jgi:CheY-like chemotaxis protein